MKRNILESFLRHKVKITLFDGDMYIGFLYKTGSEKFVDEPNLFIPKNYYVLLDENDNCVSCIFRTSHVKNIKNWD